MNPRLSSVTDATHDGLTFHVLREPSTGSEAWILPDVGASCVRFVTAVDGEPLEVIRWPESWEAFRDHPTLWGSAVLFPFPGRIRGGRFTFGGVAYQLPLNEPSPGNAIHGCVANRPWRTISRDASATAGAAATYEIGTDSQPDLAESYPFPFRLTMTIRLLGGRLGFRFTAENPGPTPFPIGLGLHPYFPLPLGEVGSVDDCEIQIDAPYYWEQEGFMAKGEARRAEESVDLHTPRSLRALASVGIGGPGRMVNLVHSQFSHDRGPFPSAEGIRWSLRNPRARREIVVEADPAFPASVTYVPPSRDKISFEPHTCVPNAFNLSAEGRVAGTITLGPYAFWRGVIQLGARATSSA